MKSGGEVPVCYGVEWDNMSLAIAAVSLDPCDWKITVVAGCAPGWSDSYLLKRTCNVSKACIADAEERHAKDFKAADDLKDIGGQQMGYG
jgi:hypothetical protein